MPKATVLTPDELNPSIAKTPAAATMPRGSAKEAKAAKKEAVPSDPTLPLQLRLPRPEVKAIKVAAAQQEQTISEFMLACFHAYMQTGKQASMGN